MKAIIANYLTIALVLAFLLPLSVCFAEQWHTFYWDAAYCRELMQSEGLGRLVKDFFLQFLATRWSAALLLALPCALCSQIVLSVLKILQRRFAPRSTRLPHFMAPVLTLVACYFVLTDNEQQYKSMMCQVEDEDWQGIIEQCEGRKINNTLELNMLNLALAETGQLKKRLMQQPCHDVNSLFVLQIGSPYVAAMLADIYWSMGEISMSQMYAFEANEKMDNLSPRLLKRLVLTNIVFGHYEVAAKYLNWLEKTCFYRQWAQYYRTMLCDEAVKNNHTLRLKRACIPTENGFPSAQSTVYDLQQIIENNPEHTTSAEYLGALQQLYVIQ